MPDTISGSKLNERQLDVLAYIEQVWWTHHLVPSNEAVSEKLELAVDVVASYWKIESFRQVLENKGIIFDNRSVDVLTPQQVVLGNMLLNMHDKQSIRQKLEAVNVTSQQYHAWLKQPAFREFLRVRGEDLFKAHDHEAYLSLLETMRGGDVNALKLFFEMRGIYNPRIQVDLNVDMVLVRVVEIVSKHVTNPDILVAIADELETIVPGKSVPRAIPQSLPQVVESRVVEDVPETANNSGGFTL